MYGTNSEYWSIQAWFPILRPIQLGQLGIAQSQSLQQTSYTRMVSIPRKHGFSTSRRGFHRDSRNGSCRLAYNPCRTWKSNKKMWRKKSCPTLSHLWGVTLSGGFWFSNFRWLAVIWWHLDFLDWFKDPQIPQFLETWQTSHLHPFPNPAKNHGFVGLNKLMWKGIRYLWLAFKHRTVFQPLRFDYSREQLWLKVKTLTKHANHIQ